MFCRDTCHPEKAIFSFNSSSLPRKAESHPNLPLPVVTPQANANLSHRMGAALHGRGLPAGGDDGSWCSDSLGVVFVCPLEPSQRERERTAMSEQLWGAPLTCSRLRFGPKTTPQLWLLNTRFPVVFKKIFWLAALSLSWDSSVLVDFCLAQNHVLWILRFSAKKMSAAKLDQTSLQFFSADSF